jgi:hypothetical protein
MLRRAHEHLAMMLKDSGLERGLVPMSEWEMPSPFLDDDEDGSDDTDGSSLHTPTSTLHTLTPPPSISSKMPASYAPMRALATRLHLLVSETEARKSRERELEQERFASLEIRVRRKAWLNGFKVFSGEKSVGRWEGGFAMPFRRSPLGFCVTTQQDLDFDMEAGMDEMGQSELFPFSERTGASDRDDEVVCLAREMELGIGWEFGLDPEMGVGGMEVEVDPVMLSTRPPLRQRTRTRSMSMPPSSVGRPMLKDELERQQSPLSFLCSSLSDQKSAFDHLNAEPDFELDSEFTLAMDLPFRVRVQDAECKESERKRRYRYEQEGEWLTPRMPFRVTGTRR